MIKKLTTFLKNLSSSGRFLFIFIIIFPYTLATLFIEPFKDIYYHAKILESPSYLLKENYGKNHVLTIELLEVNEWLKSHNIKTFNVTEKLQLDSYNYQRLMESSHPIRVSSESKYLFYLQVEAIPTKCNLLEENKVFKLVKC